MRDQYRMRVPGNNFTGHYLTEMRSKNRFLVNEYRNGITLPLSEGWLEFHFPSFIQGLVSMTRTIGIAQPWLALETLQDNLWVPAMMV